SPRNSPASCSNSGRRSRLTGHVRRPDIRRPQSCACMGDIAVSWPVLAFAAGVALTVAIGLGVFTALRSTSRDLRTTLVEGGRGSAGTQRGQRVSRAIVGAQLAITVVLLVGAGLLGRSLLRVLSVD